MSIGLRPLQRMPLGELLDHLEEVVAWPSESAPLDHQTPWLVRRDLVREAAARLRQSGYNDNWSDLPAHSFGGHAVPGGDSDNG